ncbi:P27 family phage terminase small subunit [Lysinibacillus sp. NPDC097287]|uniref:P27 family phage terminase small subunit n=1 Tax=Lysinibacillus sp. NPDC097287 TaxID=3364144 RepID=UPI0038246725
MKKQLRETVIENMKHLGVYREDFEHTIDVYVDMLVQYKMFEQQFADSGYKLTDSHTNKAGATNERKAPIYMAMEALRKDLAKYSDLLCLNPRAYERVKKPEVPVRKKEEEKPKSKLIQALSDSS